MFFHLNGYTDILPEVEPGLHLDEGWRFEQLNHSRLYYKGYTDSGTLADNLVKIYYGQRPAGIWAVVEARSDTHAVYTPRFRGFPLYQRDKVVTNLALPDLDFLPSKQNIEFSTDTITIDEAATQIGSVLRRSIENILRQHERVNVLFSGGIDSLVLLAIVHHLTDNYCLRASMFDVAAASPDSTLADFYNIQREYTSTLTEFADKRYWGYELLSNHRHATANITGFWGDEIMYRNPDHVDLLARTQGATAKSAVQPQDYMYEYLMRSEFKLSGTVADPVNETVRQQIWDWLQDDCQMWHLNHELHYSPYYNVEIFRIMSQLSTADLLKHGTTAIVQRRMLEMFAPEFLMLLADQKNTTQSWLNFQKNFTRISGLSEKLAV